MVRAALTTCVGILAIGLACATRSSAQAPGGAAGFGVDPSVRASGMGRASTAVFWGGDPNYWANPALLGYHRGLRFEGAKTQLVPDLADDVFFRTSRICLAAAGVGFAFGGMPDGFGRQRLDYGWSIATDEQGDEVGRFRSWEKVTSWSVGGNVAEAAEFLLERAGLDPPRLSPIADVSIGRTWKEDEVFLRPRQFLVGEEWRGRVSAHDQGYLVRITPFNSVDGTGLLGKGVGALESLGGVRLDMAYGRSWQSEGGGVICFSGGDDCNRVLERRRTGWAVRAACGLPPGMREALPGSRRPWVAAALNPFVSVGATWDRLEEQGEIEAIDHLGMELALANVLTIRYGRIDDPDGDIQGNTWGVGLGIPIGDFAGLRWDHASVPQATGLDRVHRNSVTAFIDPLAFARAVGNDRR